MAKKQFHYYVLVFNGGSPVFVTSVGGGHMAYWNKEEKPMGFRTRDRAEDVCIGLLLNGFNAVLVSQPIEITEHPYNYKEYHIEWVKNEGDEDGKND